MPNDKLTGCEEMFKYIITDLEQRKRSLEASQRALRIDLEGQILDPDGTRMNIHDYSVGIDTLNSIIRIYKYEEPHIILVCLNKAK